MSQDEFDMKAIKEQPAIQELEGTKAYETNISRDGSRMLTRKEPKLMKQYFILFVDCSRVM